MSCLGNEIQCDCLQPAETIWNWQHRIDQYVVRRLTPHLADGESMGLQLRLGVTFS